MTTHTQMSVSGLRAKVQENIPVPVLGCWIPPPRLRPGGIPAVLGCSRWVPSGQGCRGVWPTVVLNGRTLVQYTYKSQLSILASLSP